jgi:hypothetical protein
MIHEQVEEGGIRGQRTFVCRIALKEHKMIFLINTFIQAHKACDYVAFWSQRNAALTCVQAVLRKVARYFGR